MVVELLLRAGVGASDEFFSPLAFTASSSATYDWYDCCESLEPESLVSLLDLTTEALLSFCSFACSLIGLYCPT